MVTCSRRRRILGIMGYATIYLLLFGYMGIWLPISTFLSEPLLQLTQPRFAIAVIGLVGLVLFWASTVVLLVFAVSRRTLSSFGIGGLLFGFLVMLGAFLAWTGQWFIVVVLPVVPGGLVYAFRQWKKTHR